MPVKYKRDRLIGQGREKHVVSRKGPFRGRRISARQKLLIIYLGILAASLCIVVLTQMSQRVQFIGRPLIFGAGEIVEMRPEEDATLVRLRMLVAEGRTADGWTDMPTESARKLKAGDWVAARYRISRNGYEVRIEACGLVALPPESG